LPNQKENFDVFAVPRNFGEDGMTFNGISRRNLVEGVILAIGSGYPMFRYLPASLSVRIILLCFISLPLFFAGLVGAGGESLSQFFVTVLKWLFTRRKLRYYIDTGEPEPQRSEASHGRNPSFRKRMRMRFNINECARPGKPNSAGFYTACFRRKKPPLIPNIRGRVRCRTAQKPPD
jgi:hypothetical protein